MMMSQMISWFACYHGDDLVFESVFRCSPNVCEETWHSSKIINRKMRSNFFLFLLFFLLVIQSAGGKIKSSKGEQRNRLQMEVPASGCLTFAHREIVHVADPSNLVRTGLLFSTA